MLLYHRFEEDASGAENSKIIWMIVPYLLYRIVL